MKDVSHGSYHIGYGEDSHRLEDGKPLVLGGYRVPGAARGAVAHSDGDALLHAISDALLSTFALADIGDHFPPDEVATAGIDSRDILRHVLTRVLEASPDHELVNCAAVVTLDAPRLGPHREAITRSCSTLLGIAPDRFGLTFKTSEGLAPDHVQARAVVLISTDADPTWHRRSRRTNANRA